MTGTDRIYENGRQEVLNQLRELRDGAKTRMLKIDDPVERIKLINASYIIALAIVAIGAKEFNPEDFYKRLK